MDKKTIPLTFNNIDYETGRILITPHGPDPVLLGIRGETPDIVYKAFLMLEIKEPIEGWVIFKTNQATNDHFKVKTKISMLQLYSSVIVEGQIIEKPKIITGGHVISMIKDNTGKAYIAAYKQTGEINRVLRSLTIGDKIMVYGSVNRIEKNNIYTINIEALKIISSSVIKNCEYENDAEGCITT